MSTQPDIDNLVYPENIESVLTKIKTALTQDDDDDDTVEESVVRLSNDVNDTTLRLDKEIEKLQKRAALLRQRVDVMRGDY